MSAGRVEMRRRSTTSIPTGSGRKTPTSIMTSSGRKTPTPISTSSGRKTPTPISTSSGRKTPTPISTSSGRKTPTSISTSSGWKTPTGRSKVTQFKDTNRVTSKRRSAPSTPVDKATMLIMEANEISECLQKDYVFTKIEDIYKEECDTKIKVTNKKAGESCVWDLPKLKERLVHMRKLVYAPETESSMLTGESAFYYPSDVWVKDGEALRDGNQNFKPISHSKWEEENKQEISTETESESDKLEKKLGCINPDLEDVLSKIPYGFHGNRSTPSPVTRPNVLTDEEPVKLTNKVRSQSNGTLSSAGSSELPADSEFLSTMMSPSPGPDSQESMLSDKYFRDNLGVCDRETRKHSRRRTYEVKKSHAYAQTLQTGGTPFLKMCKHMADLTNQRLQGIRSEWTLVDRLLSQVESLKVCVVSLLEAYTQVMETGEGPVALSDSELVRMCGLRLVASQELLVANTSCWLETLDTQEPSNLTDLCSWIHSTLQELISELPIFLQACGCEDSDHTQDTASQVLDNMFELSKQYGALALTTGATPLSLAEPARQTLEELMTFTSYRDDIFNSEPGDDLKQSFLTGCDTCVGRTLVTAVSTIEEWDDTLGQLPKQQDPDIEKLYDDVHRSVKDVLMASRYFVLKCQTIQKQAVNTMKQDEQKPKNYFFHYYNRCLSLVRQSSHVTNSLVLLSQASCSFLEGGGITSIRKVIRCAQLLCNATTKMMTASNHDTSAITDSSSSPANSIGSVGTDLKSDSSKTSSVLSEAQTGRIKEAGHRVERGLKELVAILQRHMESSTGEGEGVEGSRTKRMLPSTPAKSVTRNSSSKSFNKQKLTRAMSMADIALDSDMY